MQPNIQNTMQNSLGQLKDIKSIVDVPDNSLYILIAIISVVVIVVLFLAFKYFTRIKKTKQLTIKEIALKKLKNLDYENTKEIVYSFSVDGALFINEKNKEQFELLEKELKNYKYKKIVEKLPNDLKDKIKNYIKGVKK